MKELVQEVAMVLLACGAMWLAFTAAGIAQSDFTDEGVGCVHDCLQPAE